MYSDEVSSSLQMLRHRKVCTWPELLQLRSSDSVDFSNIVKFLFISC